MTSLVCAAAAKGLGASISAADFASRVALQKLLIAAFPPYFLCNMFIKHAWLTFYYGLARTRLQRYFTHFMQFVAAGFGISSVLVILLQCVPLSHVWTKHLIPPTEDGAKCIDLINFFYANSIIMIVNDTVMYLMPVFMLQDVDMLRGHRWGIYTLFGVGGVVVLASILRLLAVHQLAEGHHFSQSYALVFLWAAVENHVGICAACGGALKQKSMTAYDNIRRSYCSIRHKSYPTPSLVTRSQNTEDRSFYERTDSLPTPSLGVDSKDAGMRMELYNLQPVETQTAV
ncbi:hypothetical protein LTR10_024241 [Elasticomyces elasticus]|uniref:Rhodopsin domain-containing protein n=1 Tax=Exophiala sideris TaxID=1016849 RepID=A0ABR0JIJ2_9EURO|nr:hypothetical protein LTR10_024241 [Elasticomyces elasticus]KAK5034421.1 hypothetical protein LTS07_003342 [Exophiala sideris]KAK5042718.1 hypothetical protein LTR13_001566 [Exophiala sideris]KAK5065801.1 hypothetical protein LTR69_003351 [Exophiala sideris]KAK5185738.1 hypothetical protein LTR44_001787 [Eurotiomycetes sp. CCFEE 6388]